MMSYEATMRCGEAQYRDVLDTLEAAGWPADFIQTGGMNAALMAPLEDGSVLLITDAEESLAWYRDEHRGWCVAVHRSQELGGEGALTADTCESNDVDDLLALIRTVIRQHLRSRKQD